MAAERNPTVFFVRYALAAALAKAGRQDDAEWQLDELYAMGFDMTLQEVMAQNPIQDPATRDSYFEGLRKAGFE